jgi:hypothetical protein
MENRLPQLTFLQTAGTNDVPPVRNTISISDGRTPADASSPSTQVSGAERLALGGALA